MERLRITVDGKTYDVIVERTDTGDVAAPAPAAVPAPAPAPPPVAAPPPAAQVPVAPAPPPAPAPSAGAGDMPSPLAGVVQAVEVAVGAQVKEGDLVITLEAMKMYTPINSPASGTVSAIHVAVGQAVEEGQPLFTIS